MKNIKRFFILVLLLLMIPIGVFAGGSDDDAVERDPADSDITDSESGKQKITITEPITIYNDLTRCSTNLGANGRCIWNHKYDIGVRMSITELNPTSYDCYYSASSDFGHFTSEVKATFYMGKLIKASRISTSSTNSNLAGTTSADIVANWDKEGWIRNGASDFDASKRGEVAVVSTLGYKGFTYYTCPEAIYQFGGGPNDSSQISFRDDGNGGSSIVVTAVESLAHVNNPNYDKKKDPEVYYGFYYTLNRKEGYYYYSDRNSNLKPAMMQIVGAEYQNVKGETEKETLVCYDPSMPSDPCYKEPEIPDEPEKPDTPDEPKEEFVPKDPKYCYFWRSSPNDSSPLTILYGAVSYLGDKSVASAVVDIKSSEGFWSKPTTNSDLITNSEYITNRQCPRYAYGYENSSNVVVFSYNQDDFKDISEEVWVFEAKNYDEQTKKPVITNPVNPCNIVPESIKTWIKDTLNLVRYVALALVIVLGVLDFIKAAASGEADQMKKSGQDFLKRIIAVVVLFLVPLIVELIINLIEIYGANNDCFGLWS